MAVAHYFLGDDGSTFKVVITKDPYFYLDVEESEEGTVEMYLRNKYPVTNVEMEEKLDLDQPKHLSGARKNYMKVSFNTVSDLLDMRRDLLVHIKKNKRNKSNEKSFGDHVWSKTKLTG
eukprot:CAMPEP_0174268436 /NCGR_PEP_ID=MMETSP0439-20130205/37457_1 /TAXON_ID=0 /ORGANISM="Stereomyxa ramosa, Strain Chinc5" /LENGTH=118 /DNA_ID=CAMNT_0015356605 /DNA_START=141 /DNA_END=493 /DNA_ORIENTATION=+